MSPNRRDRDTHAVETKPKPMSSLGQNIWNGFMLSYGLLSGLSWILLMLRDGVLFQRRSNRVTDKELADGSFCFFACPALFKSLSLHSPILDEAQTFQYTIELTPILLKPATVCGTSPLSPSPTSRTPSSPHPMIILSHFTTSPLPGTPVPVLISLSCFTAFRTAMPCGGLIFHKSGTSIRKQCMWRWTCPATAVATA